MRQQLHLAAAFVLALAGGAGYAVEGASAQAPSTPAPADQAAPAPAGQAAPAPSPHRNFSFNSHIDGRIAYLKAELKITPAQEHLFDKVAQAMRDTDADMKKDFEARQAARGTAQSAPESAVDRLDAQVKMMQQRVRSRERYVAAFKPLYASLSPDQQKIADQMLAPHQRPGQFPRRF